MLKTMAIHGPSLRPPVSLNAYSKMQISRFLFSLFSGHGRLREAETGTELYLDRVASRRGL
jgi:hypothetical protein